MSKVCEHVTKDTKTEKKGGGRLARTRRRRRRRRRSLLMAGWVNAEALMPARVCAYIEAVYTLFCYTLTKRRKQQPS